MSDNNGWRDIETAPKDGTDILVYFEWQVQARYSPASLGISEGWYTPSGHFVPNPTAWQPLPAPPEVKE